MPEIIKAGSVNNLERLPYDDATKARLTAYVELLTKLPEIQRIVLFGSYARMEQKVGSDIDILALTSSELSRETRAELHCEFEERDADLVFYTEEQFQTSDCVLVQNIRRDGVLLWAV